MNSFIEDYFGEEDIFYIFLLNRNKTPSTTKQFFHNKKNFQYFYNLNYQKWNKSKVDIYYSVNSFRYVNNKISRRESNVNMIKSLFFDIDTNGPEIKNKIIKELGQPTYLIQTSPEKFQLLYTLNDEIEKDDFKLISQNLTYHFDTDTTFDLARVGRLPLCINNKNGFEVKYLKSDYTYDIKHFQDYLNKNEINYTTKNRITLEKKVSKIPKKERPIIPPGEATEQYIERYKYFYQQTQDYSATDFRFVKYLVKAKKLKRDKTIWKHFYSVCENIEQRHGHNLYDYFLTILEKVRYGN